MLIPEWIWYQESGLHTPHLNRSMWPALHTTKTVVNFNVASSMLKTRDKTIVCEIKKCNLNIYVYI